MEPALAGLFFGLQAVHGQHRREARERARAHHAACRVPPLKRGPNKTMLPLILAAPLDWPGNIVPLIAVRVFERTNLIHEENTMAYPPVEKRSTGVSPVIGRRQRGRKAMGETPMLRSREPFPRAARTASWL